MTRRLLILAYHRVLPHRDPLRAGDIPVASFAAQMSVLARFFNVLPLAEAAQRLSDSSLPPRAVCITFDDGYADNYTLAWPVLRDFHLPWTLFVATGYLDGGRMWNDAVIDAVERASDANLDLRDIDLDVHTIGNDAERAAAIQWLLRKMKYMESGEREGLAGELARRTGASSADDLMLTREQLAELARAGVDIGGHTVTHPILKAADPVSANTEIVAGKQELESLLDMPIRSFAYPNGRPGQDYDASHVEMVRRAGFSCAVSTENGAADVSSDLLQLPRFGPWGESPWRFGARLLRMFL